MTISEDKIFLDIYFDGAEINRQIGLGLKRIPLHKRILCSPSRLFINFVFSLLFFYLIGRITTFSIFLSLISAVILTAFSPGIFFQLNALVINFLEQRFKKTQGYTASLLYGFQFDDTGIKMRNSHETIETKWMDIVEAIETEKDLAVFFDEAGCYIFPKRIFSTFEEMSVFKNFLRQKLGDNVKF